MAAHAATAERSPPGLQGQRGNDVLVVHQAVVVLHVGVIP